MVDGKLVQIDHSQSEKMIEKKRKGLFDASPSGAGGVKNVDFKDSKKLAPDLVKPKIKTQEDDNVRDKIAQSSSLSDQDVSLPARITPRNNMTSEEMNRWGENLAKTREWVDFQVEKIQENQDQIERSYLIMFNTIYEEWKEDVRTYRKALEAARLR